MTISIKETITETDMMTAMIKAEMPVIRPESSAAVSVPPSLVRGPVNVRTLFWSPSSVVGVASLPTVITVGGGLGSSVGLVETTDVEGHEKVSECIR